MPVDFLKKPRLLIADDHELLLDGLRKLLEPDFDLVGSASDGRTAVSEFVRLQPDLVLLDIGMPLLNGIEAARQIRKLSPRARILFVTMQTGRVYIEEAFAAGASGYVLKQAAARELVDAIHAVLRGGRFLSRQLGVMAVTQETMRTSGKLTPRQREVLQLIAEGKSMKEIAAILNISVRTVEFHKRTLIDELGVRTTAELTRYALDQHIAV